MLVFKGQTAEKVIYMAKKVVLSCEKCGSRNYSVPKKDGATERLELKKFCSHCNEHTTHKQTL
ncbi:50S ribosomal protein L33 [Solibacillus merdavium]